MNLVQFLLARIDEEIARADSGGNGRVAWVTLRRPDGQLAYTTVAYNALLDEGEWDDEWVADGHSLEATFGGGVFWDQDRAFAEARAKRQVVEACRRDYADSLVSGDDTTSLAEEVLQALAAQYADHPDYDGAWRQ